MNRLFHAAWVVLISSAASLAGPIPWTYSATFKPANGADGIVLGNETFWEMDPVKGGEKGTAYFILSNVTKSGYSASGSETPTITPQTPNNSVTLFDFGYGAWTTREQLPANQTLAMNRFVLEYAFADGQGETYRGSVEGLISASGIFTSGTGNFSIDLDHTDTVKLGNRKAKVRFWGSNNESHSVILMDVTDVVETPEPATIALAGMGLAGVLGYRGRWLRKRQSVV
jgi:hypothetical protein